MRPALLAWLLLSMAPSLGAADGPGSLEKPAGTGVIVHSEGYILTAQHVVGNARRIVVVTSGEFRAPALLVASDPDHDLALLKIETVGLSPAPVGYAGAVTLDQEVIVVGFPFGLREPSISHGRISAVRTKGIRRVFQIDAAVNPGNSGGPVFNGRGELIGLVTTKFSHPSGIVPEGMGFAMPISYALPLLANIPEFDFSAIGKLRPDPKAKRRKRANGDLVTGLSRTTVRIETARSMDSTVMSPPSGKGEPGRGPHNSGPVPALEPEPNVQDDAEVVRRVHDEIASGQRKELQALEEKGIQQPEGMALIPRGEFVMGADHGPPDARPVHRVTLSAYWIDRHEATNSDYRRCLSDGVCTAPKDRQRFDDRQHGDHPVTNVTWKQAYTYCQWRGGRLPTEAEWEKAARGPEGWRYPWGNSEGPIKTRRDRMAAGPNGTTPVGASGDTRSPYGLFDMVGNVWEWVKDWYAEDYYAAMPSHDPQGPLSGTFRVLRGGDWSQSPLELRASFRGWDDMTYWGPTLGFRCAADVP
jgi:formylglycine-generating enzyme required for sulfatase activity